MIVSPDRQLKGKTNFITWRRGFERAAKAQDVLDLLKGDEEILEKPNKDDYLYDDSEGKTTQAQAVTATNNNSILCQADYKLRMATAAEADQSMAARCPTRKQALRHMIRIKAYLNARSARKRHPTSDKQDLKGHHLQRTKYKRYRNVSKRMFSLVQRSRPYPATRAGSLNRLDDGARSGAST